MAATTHSLSELHLLHLKFEEVHSKLERGPKQIQARQRFVETKQQESADIHEKFQKLKMDADSRGLQLKTNEARIESLRGKLNAAASNKEFSIIKEQIEADQVANSVLEDEILEALEKIDITSTEVGKAEQVVKDAEAETNRISLQITESKSGLEAESERLKATIKVAETSIPPRVGEQYRRLVQAHGASALAAVTDSVCSNCFVSVTAQMLILLNTHQVIFCKTCGRMLYVDDSD
jgi:predicted  nucleic acid-binding Zn-ribbon protein